MTLIYPLPYLKGAIKLINDNIIILNDIKNYSNELLNYIKNFTVLKSEVLEEILIYFKASISQIDDISDYILYELERNN